MALTIAIAPQTLPARWYTDPAIYERERDVVFGSNWQLAVFSPDVAAPGSYAVGAVGDREVVVVRDGAGTLRAFHNVCQHRGNLIAEGAGRCTTLQCPYHAWTYDLDGQLRQAPGMDAIDVSSVQLRPVHVEERYPFVFVNPGPSPMPGVGEVFGGLFDALAETGVDFAALVTDGVRMVREWGTACNWKLLVENSLECYHCAPAHPSLRRTLDLAHFTQDVDARWSLQGGRMKKDADAELLDETMGEFMHAQALTIDGTDVARFGFLYPNVMLEVFPGSKSFSVNQIFPVGHDHTRQVLTKFFSGASVDDERRDWDEFIAPVIQEDIVLCERTQRGLASGAIERGMLNLSGSGANELCIGHFVALVEQALA
jgi:choline monooxygenase